MLKLTGGSISALLQLPLNLPAVLVVWSVMKELAAVWRWDTRTPRVSQDVVLRMADILETTFNTYLQNHRIQSPCSLCRYLADSPTWLWLGGVQVLGSALFCLKSLPSCQWKKGLESRWWMFRVPSHLTIPEEALPMVVSFGLMNFT